MTDMVSIIVPVYNAQPYIKKNIESVINQSYRNLEIIYVDDGSTDRSLQIIQTYAETDFRIKIIEQENHGVSTARNTGLKVATGKYVTFLDADDYLDRGYTEVLLNGLLESDADISCCSYTLHRPDKDILLHDTRETVVWNNQEAMEQLIRGSLLDPGVWAKLFRAEILSGLEFCAHVRYTEDYLLNLEAFGRSKRVVFQGKPYYHYVLHPNSATTGASVEKRERDVVCVAEIAATMPFDERIKELLQEKKLTGYLQAYNALLYGEGGTVTELKEEIRSKIVNNKQSYHHMTLSIKQMFYFYGITYSPRLYHHAYRVIKSLLPDRRVFRI